MKKLLLLLPFTALALNIYAATGADRERGQELGMMLDLQKISLGTISSVEQKKQYLSTVQLEKQRIQNYTLRVVYENAYTLYRRGDYERAQELANVILSIDPSLTQAQTLATEAGRMATYGTVSEQTIIDMKFEEGISLYKSGKLIEAQGKFNEILVLRPNDSRAQGWVDRINDEIAQEHIRRGFYAYKNKDYQEALNQWYSVLLIKKDDKDLTAKIAEVETTMKKDQNQAILNNAFALYSKGQLIAAYREFERAMEIQPGEQQTQKFMMQLKQEIAKGYYTAGNQAYGSRKYNSAIANWKEAKNWGYNQNDIALLVKNAERAKAAAAEAARRRAAAAALARKQKQQAAAAAAAAAAAKEQEASDEKDEDEGTEDTSAMTSSATPVAGENTSQAITSTPTQPFPSKVLTNQPVSEEARQASIARYKSGLSYFNANDYANAKEEWQAALQLDPENTDAALGIKRIESEYSNR